MPNSPEQFQKIIDLETCCPDDWLEAQKHTFWMRQALKVAAYSEQLGEVPVGAVAVVANQLVSVGWNAPISEHDPTAHAEVMALREAGKALGNYRQLQVTLYVTLEPCPMCAGAIVHARLLQLVYGTKDLKTGAVDSVFRLVSDKRLNHQLPVLGGVLEAECREQLQAFFKRRRAEKKAAKKLVKQIEGSMEAEGS